MADAQFSAQVEVRRWARTAITLILLVSIALFLVGYVAIINLPNQHFIGEGLQELAKVFLLTAFITGYIEWTAVGELAAQIQRLQISYADQLKNQVHEDVVTFTHQINTIVKAAASSGISNIYSHRGSPEAIQAVKDEYSAPRKLDRW